MQPSRRAVIGIAGASTVTLFSGCTAPTVAGSDTGDSEFEVRLRGPEADRILFEEADVTTVGAVRERNDSFFLPVTLTDGATSAISETFRSAGVDDDPGEFEIVQRYDGEVVYRAGITRELAENIAEREWDGELVMAFERRERATELRETLANGNSG